MSSSRLTSLLSHIYTHICFPFITFLPQGNILINHNADVKIADFGVLTALESTHDMARTYIGTTAFMSPERVTNDAYSASSDIWSLVCIFRTHLISLLQS